MMKKQRLFTKKTKKNEIIFPEQEYQRAYVSESEVDMNANEEGSEAEDIIVVNEILNEEEINAGESETNNDNDNITDDDGDGNSLDEEVGISYDEEIQIDDDADDSSSVRELSSMEGDGTVRSDKQPRVRRSARSNASKGVPNLRVSFSGRTYSSAEELSSMEGDSIVHSERVTLRETQCQVKCRQRSAKVKSSEVNKQFMMKVMNNAGEATDIMKHAIEVMFTQMKTKKGIMLFGERAVAAVYKKYKQLNDPYSVQ